MTNPTDTDTQNAERRESLPCFALDGDKDRDFTVQPIVITEVALAVQEATGRRIISAATVPFTFNQDALTYSPNPRRMWDIDPEVSLPLKPVKQTYLGWD
ncbi:MAG: hypothetical protein WA030_01570 [Candidatus Microsaccharimonas sp.]